MKIESLQGLLDAEPAKVEHAEFEGAWDLFSIRDKLIDAQSTLRTRGVQHVRQLTEALKRRFPFDYKRAYNDPGSRIEALAKGFPGPANVSPTPFLPVLLFVLTVDGAAADLSEDELSMLAGYGVHGRCWPSLTTSLHRLHARSTNSLGRLRKPNPT